MADDDTVIVQIEGTDGFLATYDGTEWNDNAIQDTIDRTIACLRAVAAAGTGEAHRTLQLRVRHAGRLRLRQVTIHYRKRNNFRIGGQVARWRTEAVTILRDSIRQRAPTAGGSAGPATKYRPPARTAPVTQLRPQRRRRRRAHRG